VAGVSLPAHPDGYGHSQFSALYRQWRSTIDVVMRQTHRAGEKLFVDYAGQTVDVNDPTTGEVRSAQIFVATLGASNYTYVEAAHSQNLPAFIAAHQRALALFGGVPELVVPDNLKSGITTPHRYEPLLNRAYHMPHSHQAQQEWSPERFIAWGRQTGPATAELLAHIMTAREHPQLAFRSCLGIMRLGKHYGTQRLEAAALRALSLKAYSYKSLDSILRKRLDQQPLLPPPDSIVPISHDNIRGPEYYTHTPGDNPC